MNYFQYLDGMLLVLFLASVFSLLQIIWIFHDRMHERISELMLIITICYSNLIFEASTIVYLLTKPANIWWQEFFTFLTIASFINSICFASYISYSTRKFIFQPECNLNTNFIYIFAMGLSASIAFIQATLNLLHSSDVNNTIIAQISRWFICIPTIAIPTCCIVVVLVNYLQARRYMTEMTASIRIAQYLMLYPMIMMGCVIWTILLNVFRLTTQDDVAIRTLWYMMQIANALMGLLDCFIYGKCYHYLGRTVAGFSFDSGQTRTSLFTKSIRNDSQLSLEIVKSQTLL